jgi:hypothetical protein
VHSKRFGGWVMMGLLLGCATAAPPQQAPSTAAPSTAAPSTQKDEKVAAADAKKDKDSTLVCESVSVTGSRIPKKVCRTVRQIEQEREQAEKAIRDADKINRDWGK